MPYFVFLFALSLSWFVHAITAAAAVYVIPHRPNAPKSYDARGPCASAFIDGLQFYQLTGIMVQPDSGFAQIEAWTLENRNEVYRAKEVLPPDEILKKQSIFSAIPSSRSVIIAAFDDADVPTKEDYRVSVQLSASGKSCVTGDCDAPSQVPMQSLYPDARIAEFYPNAIEASLFAPHLNKDPMVSMVDIMIDAIKFLSLRADTNLLAKTTIVIEAIEDAKPSLVPIWEKMGFRNDPRIVLKAGRRFMYIPFSQALKRYTAVTDQIDLLEMMPWQGSAMLEARLAEQQPQIAKRNRLLHYHLATMEFVEGHYERALDKVQDLRLTSPHDSELRLLEVFLRFAKHLSFLSLRGDSGAALAELKSMREDPTFAQKRLPSYLAFDVFSYLESLALLLDGRLTKIEASEKPAFALTPAHRIISQVGLRAYRINMKDPKTFHGLVESINARVPISNIGRELHFKSLILAGYGLNADLYENLAAFYEHHWRYDDARYMQLLAHRARQASR